MVKRPTIRKRVSVCMPGIRLEGTFAVPEGLRVSDFLNDSNCIFVSVVDVKIYDWKGDFLEDKEFMAVNKERITWIAEV